MSDHHCILKALGCEINQFPSTVALVIASPSFTTEDIAMFKEIGIARSDWSYVVVMLFFLVHICCLGDPIFSF